MPVPSLITGFFVGFIIGWVCGGTAVYYMYKNHPEIIYMIEKELKKKSWEKRVDKNA